MRMKIGTVAKEAGVSVQAVRYYEAKGLLLKPVRDDNGYRMYDQNAVPRIKFIQKAQETGFSLNEISELLNLKMRNQDQCQKVRSRIDLKLETIQRRIEDLQHVHQGLIQLRSYCTVKKSSKCPAIEVLMEGIDES